MKIEIVLIAVFFSFVVGILTGSIITRKAYLFTANIEQMTPNFQDGGRP